MKRVRRRTLLTGSGAAAALAALGCARAAQSPTPDIVAPAQTETSLGRTTPFPTTTPLARVKPSGPTATPPLPTPTNTLVPPRPTVTPRPPTATVTPVARGAPQQLEIPKLGVVAPILGIGTTPTGDLDSPQGPQVVGWFVGGPKPGDVDNALLTGHLDWRTGETGVFWDLKKLVPGDEVLVKTERELLRFAVDRTNVCERDRAPVEQILGFALGRVVTILTCEGQFIRTPNATTPGDYTHRRVVRANLVSPAA